jgi:hypothetical protein
MFIRDNLTKNIASKKKKDDEHARVRNQILNFRTTLEERKKIEDRIALSGLTKSEFLIQSCMNQKIVVQGNVKVFAEINKQLAVIMEHITSTDFPENLDEDILENLRTIMELSAGLNLEK